MQQTPLREYFNPNVLSLIPKDATRVIEVGCGGGSTAREYSKINPRFDYVGIERLDSRSRKAARSSTTKRIAHVR
jgi:tRNA G46 methylase TrmB